MKKIVGILFSVFICSFYLFNDEVLSYRFYDANDITTNSVLLINEDTGETIFEKNANERLSIASLTKIMTYIIVSENVEDLKSTNILVKPEIISMIDPDSSISGLKSGDELTVFALLHCLMMSSGNDAAYVLADYIGKGSVPNFVEMMNNKVNEIGCLNTHFTGPDGMYDEDHYSTAWDMYLITKYAIKLPYFMEICGKREYKVFDDDRKLIKNTNKMLDPFQKDYYCPYVKGIKTGFLSEAGRCLISLASKNDKSYICIAIGGPEVDINNDGIKENIAMIETKNLYNWAFDNLDIKKIANKNDPLGQVKLKYAWGKDKLLLTPEKDVELILPKDITLSDIDIKFFIPKIIKTPVKKGDLVGSAKLKYNGEDLREVTLLSAENVPINILIFIVENLKSIIFSKWMLIILFLGGLYLYFTIVINKNIKNKKLKIKKTTDKQ